MNVRPLAVFTLSLALLSIPVASAQAMPASSSPKTTSTKDRMSATNAPTREGVREKLLPGAREAVERGLSFIGRADKACSNGTCEGVCLHLAAKVWGFAYSGSETALTHWKRLEALDLTQKDRRPPIGALVFWDIGWSGHVAVYAGNDMVISNWDGPEGDGVYLLPINTFENEWSSATYLGWSQPKFFGPRM